VCGFGTPLLEVPFPFPVRGYKEAEPSEAFLRVKHVELDRWTQEQVFLCVYVDALALHAGEGVSPGFGL